MPERDVIVIGGSAGGVEVLKEIMAGLPAGLRATVLVALHIPRSSPGRLADILQRRCALPVSWAVDGGATEPGHVYLAPPDQHLVVEPGHARLTRAPRENHNRPAIDPLFRSAALVYGPRTIGVVISGRLDDGTAGLWAVKDRGGVAIVQDPAEAAHPDMPRNALVYTEADHVVPADRLAPLLAALVGSRGSDGLPPASPELELEVQIAMEANALERGVMSLGPTTPYTCPECHGVLMRVGDGGIPRFRCHTGHAFSLDSLLASVTESVEDTLWSALRAIEESVMLLREAAARVDASAHETDDVRPGARLEQKAREAEARAEMIRQAALRHQAISLASVQAIDDSARGERRTASERAAHDD